MCNMFRVGFWNLRNQDVVVSIRSMMQVGEPRKHSIPGRDKRLSFLQNILTGCGSYEASCLMGTWCFLRGVNWLGREAIHSPPSVAKLKNEEAILAFLRMPAWHAQGQIGFYQKLKLKFIRDTYYCLTSGLNITNSDFVVVRPKLLIFWTTTFDLSC